MRIIDLGPCQWRKWRYLAGEWFICSHCYITCRYCGDRRLPAMRAGLRHRGGSR